MSTTTASAPPRATTAVNNVPAHMHTDTAYTNGHHHHHHEPAVAAQHPASNRAMDKKAKGKKAPDPTEASKLIAAKISQLELDAAGEKDQEAEIGMRERLSKVCLTPAKKVSARVIESDSQVA